MRFHEMSDSGCKYGLAFHLALGWSVGCNECFGHMLSLGF